LAFVLRFNIILTNKSKMATIRLAKVVGIFGRDVEAGSVLEGHWRPDRSSDLGCQRVVTELRFLTLLNK